MCLVLYAISYIIPIIFALRNKYYNRTGIEFHHSSFTNSTYIDDSISTETTESVSNPVTSIKSSSKSHGDNHDSLIASIEVPSEPVDEAVRLFAFSHH